jgi:hypothetical protein
MCLRATKNAFLVLACVVGLSNPLAAQTATTFTYQGDLMDSGDPANGTFNLDFSLWDALSVGMQIGSTINLPAVPVTDGKFAVELDYGATAFDHNGRWLEIAVEGITLMPRHPITRSPYSIQTRGIFVDENENVGIGTTAPTNLLHVVGDAGTSHAIFGHTTGSLSASAGVYGQSDSPIGHGVFGLGAAGAGNNYGVYGRTNSANGTGVFGRAALGGSGPTYGVVGQSQSSGGIGVYGYASASSGATTAVLGYCESPTGFAGRFNGRGYFSGNVGFGVATPLYPVHATRNSDTAIYGSSFWATAIHALSSNATAIRADGGLHGLEAFSDTAVYPTIFAQNTAADGSVLWAIGDSDASLSDGGLIVAGDQAGFNLAIDADEIMARDGGQPSDLYLNAEGGEVSMGENNIHPAHAYGKIRADGVIISASSNVTGVSVSTGKFHISIAGGVLSTDVIVATDARFNSPTLMNAWVNNGQVEISCFDIALGDWEDRDDVSFVIFRP